MAEAWLSGISQVKRAFSRMPTPKDERVAAALKVLRSSEGDDTGMGFYAVLQDMIDVKRTLDEHGLTLDDDQLQKLIEHEKEFEELKRARIIFLMPIGLSVALVIVAPVILLFGSPSDELAKFLYGLLGMVVGYWLR